MLKLLVKKQFTEVFRSYYYNDKKQKGRSKASVIALFVMFGLIMVGILGGMFTALSLALCPGLAQAGADWLFFDIMALLSLLLGVFGSVFNTYSGLYLAKDNDLLFSMPIPAKTIVASRLINVFILGVLYSVIVFLPALIVYWIKASFTAAGVICGLLQYLTIAMLVQTLSCILGYVIARISLKLKNKSFITVLISLIFIGAYYFFYFKAQMIIQDLVQNALVYGEKIKGSAYPVYLFGKGCCGDWKAAGLYFAAAALLLFAVWKLLERSFFKIAASSGKVKKAVYREKYTGQKSVFAAVLRKEFARFTSSANYMMNCGLGIIFIPVIAVMILLKGDLVLGILNEIFSTGSGTASVMFIAAVCTAASMNDMTAPSVSLEGKNLWLMQSLPVDPRTVLRAKLSMALLLTGIPVFGAGVCLAVVLKEGILIRLLAVILPVLFVVFMTEFGLFLNLLMPNLSWTSELSPIKQSAPVFFSLFGGFAIIAAFVLLYLWVGYRIGAAGYLCAAAVLFIILCAALYLWLMKKGAKRYQTL